MILILYELFTIMVFVLSRVGATNVPCGTMIRFIVPLNNSMLYKRNKTAVKRKVSQSVGKSTMSSMGVSQDTIQSSSVAPEDFISQSPLPA